MKTKFPDLALNLDFRPADTARARRFNAEQVRQYNEQGYITDVRLFEGERLKRLQEFFLNDYDRMAAEIQRRSPSVAFMNFHHLIPQVYDVVTDHALVGHLNDLIGDDVICFISQFINKKPGDPRKTVWHQDSTYNGMDSRSAIVWLAVTDATVDNGCMFFIPGTHKPAGQAEFEMVSTTAQSFGGHKIVDSEVRGAAVPIELKAGHAVFFSDKLMHSAGGNSTKDRTRAGFTMSFINADVEPRSMHNIASVICSGEDRRHHWAPHHARPSEDSVQPENAGQ
jgi:ectoine hydroxylase-related dioxygenase (phytanoyl-CoA dioxygenase family)